MYERVEMSAIDKRKYWEKVVEEFEKSGLNQKEFSAQEGILNTRLSYWCCKLRGERSHSFPKESGFVEIGHKPKEGDEPQIELELPRGIILRILG